MRARAQQMDELLAREYDWNEGLRRFRGVEIKSIEMGDVAGEVAR